MKLTISWMAALLCAGQVAGQKAMPVNPMAAQSDAAQTSTAQPAPLSAEAQQIQKMQELLNDWPQLNRYRKDNAALAPPATGEQRVVFFGDSITDGWGRWQGRGPFFPGKPYVNRGISGQTTPQMLVRFEQDVVALHPAAVVILAGTNDIAGNTGPSTPQMIEDNFTSMAQIAKANGIHVILASITPVFDYPWKPGLHPVEEIRALNQWMKTYCAANGCVYLDYYSAMSDPTGAMLPGLAYDGVHPTEKGYAIMGPLAEAAIAKALAK